MKCKCGCGQDVKEGNNWINGHNLKMQTKRVSGFALWRERDYEGYIKHQRSAGIKGYQVSKNKGFGANALDKWRKEHPDEWLKQQSISGKIGGKIGGNNTVLRHPNLMSENGKKTYRLHPEMAKDKMIELNKKGMCFTACEKKTEKGISPEPEKIMAKLLPNDFLHGKLLEKYIPDFHSKERKIVIEIDGREHKEKSKKEIDAKRMKFFNSIGYMVFRIPNKDVYSYFQKLGGDVNV